MNLRKTRGYREIYALLLYNVDIGVWVGWDFSQVSGGARGDVVAR